MPDIVSPLIGDYMDRRNRHSAGEPLSPAEFARLAEYEAALKRVAANKLELRRDDGTLVRTETVAIQDVEALLACYDDDDETWEDELEGAFEFFDDDPSEEWKRDSEDEAERALRRDMEHDLKLIDEWIDERAENREWTPEDAEPLPRYQICVLLSDERAVP